MSLKGLLKPPRHEMLDSTTVMEACDVMHREKVGALAVVDGGKLRGIFTYQDLVDRVILQKRDPAATKLADVMTAEVDSLTPERSYGDALRLMVDKDYTYVPVVADGDKLLGMLSLREVLEHKIDHLASELDSVTQYLSVDGPGGD